MEEAVRDKSPLEESGMAASHWLSSMASHWLGCCWARGTTFHLSWGWVSGQELGAGAPLLAAMHTAGLLSPSSRHHPTWEEGLWGGQWLEMPQGKCPEPQLRGFIPPTWPPPKPLPWARPVTSPGSWRNLLTGVLYPLAAPAHVQTAK